MAMAESFEENTDFRIILFGISGSGVSSTGNTILGRAAFETGTGFSSITSSCKLQGAHYLDRRVAVVDTPGFPVGMEDNKIDEILSNLREAVTKLVPGPNVFVLVVSIERYTEDHRFMVRCLEQLHAILNFTIVVFNRLDNFKGTKDIAMKNINKSATLRDLLKICSQRFVLFDNTTKDDSQVRDFFIKADELTKNNHHQNLTVDVFSREVIDQLNAVVFKRQYEWQQTMVLYSGNPPVRQTLAKFCNIL